jgi:phosphoglycolate phosphatase
MFKHFVFDLDGTLIDSVPSILEYLTLSLKENNIDPVMLLDSNLIGLSLEPTLRKVIGIDDSVVVMNLINCFKEAYDCKGFMKLIPYDGVDEMLQKISHSDSSIYLAINKRNILTLKILDYFSWCSFFDSVYTLDAGSIKFKSKADMLALIIGVNDLDPLSNLYVGDINADYFAAESCNMKFIFVEWGYEEKDSFRFPIVASNIQNFTQIILNQS